MKHAEWAAATLTVLVAACAQLPPYQNATDPNAAKLRLKMNEPIVSNLFLVAVDPEKCERQSAFSWLTGGDESVYKANRVAMIDSQPPREGILEYQVPAGKPIAAYPHVHTAKATAGQIVTARTVPTQEEVRRNQPGQCPAPAFSPQPRGEYEIVYTVRGGSCETSIYQLTRNATGVVRTEITKTADLYVTPGNDGGIVCSRR